MEEEQPIKKGRPKRGTTTAIVIKAQERRNLVMELRKAGLSYRKIADAVTEHFGVDNLPNGWDSRYAYKDVMRTLERTRLDMFEDAQAIIEIELERLDELMTTLWDIATNGDFKAIDRVLAIMERRAKLLGLDKTNLYIQADWRREAERKGINAGEIFEKLVNEYVTRIERDGIVDAEFKPIEISGDEATGGGLAGSEPEGDSEKPNQRALPSVSEEVQE